MFDLHCHLLPGVDDGAAEVEDALALARVAIDDGISHMVLTPHVHPGRYDNTRTSLEPHFAAFSARLKEEGLPLTVSLAGEVRLSAEILQMAAMDDLPFLGVWEGKKVMLLELPHSHIPPGSDKLVKWLMSRDIVPMIAHPERNKDIMNSLEKITPFVEMGCLFQVTAMSVTNEFGGIAHERAHQLLERDWVTLIASEAHNVDRRPPVLSKARQVVESVYGAGVADKLFVSTPKSIVESGACL
jgi:protein-tyrosine phosphatase